MKKNLSVLIAIFMLFAFTSCKNFDMPENYQSEEATEAVTSFLSETEAKETETDYSEINTAENESTVQSPVKEEITEKTSETIKENYTFSYPEEPATTAEETTVKTEKTEKNSASDVFSEISESSSALSEETTAAVKETTEEAYDKKTCSVQILCTSVLDKTDRLQNGKQEFIPPDGIILAQTEVPFNDGDTVFDVLSFTCMNHICNNGCSYCKAGGIQFEYTYTPAFSNYYIEGIHQLYEKDCGSLSGWMYSINGVFPNVGISSYTISDGDEISILYTCDMGADIGNMF